MPRNNLSLAHKIAKDALSAAVDGCVINNQIVIGVRYNGVLKDEKVFLLLNEIANHLLTATITLKDSERSFHEHNDPNGELFQATYGKLVVDLANFLKTYLKHKPGVLLMFIPEKSPGINNVSVDLTIKQIVSDEAFKSGLRKIVTEFVANHTHEGAHRLIAPEIKTRVCTLI